MSGKFVNNKNNKKFKKISKMKKKITVAKAEDWLTIPRANEAYEKMMDIFGDELGIKDVNEYYFEENMDTKKFRAKIKAKNQLDTRTKLIFDIVIFTDGPLKETDQGLYGKVVLKVNAILEIEFPYEENLPKVLKKTFGFIWWAFSYKRQFEYWKEVSEDKLKSFITEIRKYFNLEPPVGKIKRLHYKPIL